MTYIIGWKNSRSVFLSGDSVLTANFKMKPNEEQTSFGEKLIKTDDLSHSEKCHKIWIIENLAVGLASNDVYEAVEFLELLYEKYDKSQIEKSIKETISEFAPKKSHFLFVFFEKNENKLLRYDPDYDELIPESEPTQIGSLAEEYQDQTYEFCSHLTEQEDVLTDDDSLTLINSVHQNLLVTQKTLNHHTGGLFTGVFVNQSGINWQKDTVYLNYSGDLNKLNEKGANIKEVYYPTGMIHLINRHNCSSYTSGFNADKSAKTDHLFRCWENEDDIEPPTYISNEIIEWETKYADEVFDLFNCPKPIYISLFSNDSKFAGNLILIRSHNGNPFVKISCLEENEFTVDVNKAIIKVLKPLDNKNVYNYKILN